MPALADVIEWRLAVVLGSRRRRQPRSACSRGREPGTGAVAPERDTGTIPFDQMKWAKWAQATRPRSSAGDVLKVGDVVYVEGRRRAAGTIALRQVPEIEGALVAMDPHTGRVLAMVGGFSFAESQFNRATQALRQPGSSFKPFVYSAALDNGYTPSSVVLDAPIEIDPGDGQPIWRPENYSQDFYGPSTLRTGIEQSRNVMTVRLAQDIGMPLVAEYARRFGIYDDLPPLPADGARRRRDDGAAHGRRLRDDRQRRPQDQPDADRPHPGPLRQDHLPARRAHLRGLRRGQPGPARTSRRSSTIASRCSTR